MNELNMLRACLVSSLFAVVAAEELNSLQTLSQPRLLMFEEGNFTHCKDKILVFQWKLLQQLMAFQVAVKLFKTLIEIGRGMDFPCGSGIISLLCVYGKNGV